MREEGEGGGGDPEMFCLSRSIYFYNVHVTSGHGMAGITNSDDD